jgi:hypothetical protein
VLASPKGVGIREGRALTYQSALAKDRFAQAALSVVIGGRCLLQPDLSDLAEHLYWLDRNRQRDKGKPMGDDHLKQEAVRWARMKASN